MPTFPTYPGKLPRCLNPFNPYHWLLVLYWVYFRPTALKCYLYQANPQSYCSEGRRGNFIRSIKLPAYRRLFLTSLIAGILLSLIVSFTVVWNAEQIQLSQSMYFCRTADLVKADLSQQFCTWIVEKQKLQLTSDYWLQWSLRLVLVILIDAAICMISSFIGNATKIYLNESAVIFLLVILNSTFGVFINLSLFIIAGIIIANKFALTIPFFVYPVLSLAGCLTIGTFMCSATGMSASIFLCLIYSAFFSITFAVISGLQFNAISGVVIGIISFLFGILGSLRLPFYGMQLIGLVIPGNNHKCHPINWDELGILPVPGSDCHLSQKLLTQGLFGLSSLNQTIANPFQRWAIQRAAIQYLDQISYPVECLYKWLQTPLLDQYVITPIDRSQWRYIISTRQLLFSELIGLTITQDGRIAGNLEKIIYFLTSPLRKPLQPRLVDLLRLFYRLLYAEQLPFPYDFDSTSEAFQFSSQIVRLSNCRSLYSAVIGYPFGDEIANSFESMAQFLDFNRLEQITTAQNYLAWFDENNLYLRPDVIQALQSLGNLSSEVTIYQTASSRINKLKALARANDGLRKLSNWIDQSVSIRLPEYKILQQIIQQWSDLIIAAAGSTGRETILNPVINPYVAGPPVTGRLFVGREDILIRLESLWMQPGQIPSVVLYGHRRMGKSSILRNLPGRFGSSTHLIDFNMQRVGQVQSTGELLYNMALAIYDELPDDWQPIAEPSEASFRESNPYTTFDRFLKTLAPFCKVSSSHPAHRFIITVDEFELIEQGIQNHKLEPQLLDYWRSLIQTYPWFVLVFAGLHTLQEMTHDYWNPLFGSVTLISVSFLTPAAAANLITNPVEDFPLDYAPEAIDQIYYLTGGQPYLIQLICQNLVLRFNQQRFEEQREIEPRFTLADVDEMIASSEFYRDGNAYFQGIWDQASEQYGSAQIAILRYLSHHRSLSLEDLTEHHPAYLSGSESKPDLEAAIRILQDHDVIQKTGDQYTFRVELMRRWIERNKN